VYGGGGNAVLERLGKGRGRIQLKLKSKANPRMFSGEKESAQWGAKRRQASLGKFRGAKKIASRGKDGG